MPYVMQHYDEAAITSAYATETVVVRDRAGARTEQYIALLGDMGMPP